MSVSLQRIHWSPPLYPAPTLIKLVGFLFSKKYALGCRYELPICTGPLELIEPSTFMCLLILPVLENIISPPRTKLPLADINPFDPETFSPPP